MHLRPLAASWRCMPMAAQPKRSLAQPDETPKNAKLTIPAEWVDRLSLQQTTSPYNFN